MPMASRSCVQGRRARAELSRTGAFCIEVSCGEVVVCAPRIGIVGGPLGLYGTGTGELVAAELVEGRGACRCVNGGVIEAAESSASWVPGGMRLESGLVSSAGAGTFTGGSRASARC
jgi:hypothetical protein